jgi:hypothetical protein
MIVVVSIRRDVTLLSNTGVINQGFLPEEYPARS